MGKFQFWLPTRKLTKIQKIARDSKKPIFLTGVPGTGKTVVSIFRLINSEKGILFTYGKLLRKIIEEKVNGESEEKVNGESKQIVNIHRWHYNLTGVNLENNLSDENIDNTIEILQSQGISYDEIIVDEGQDLLPNSYKLFKAISKNVSVSADEAQKVNNLADASDEKDILERLPKLRKFTLDEIFRSSYELYNFARQFVPRNARVKNKNLLEKLKEENSGADKPFVYVFNQYADMNKVISEIIADNPTDNIGILCERTRDIREQTEYIRSIQDDGKKKYEVSSYYYPLDVPNELHNIIVTTFKSAKGIEFDIVIMPYFQSAAEENNTEYFIGVTRAKTQVFMLCIGEIPEVLNDFDKNSYKLIDKRENKEDV